MLFAKPAYKSLNRLNASHVDVYLLVLFVFDLNTLVLVLQIVLGLSLLVLDVLVELLEIGRERTPILHLRLRPNRHDSTRHGRDQRPHRMPDHVQQEFA